MENTLSRRERERLVRRQEMLRAAKAVFAEKGYASATLDEIAHRAEFGKGTLYNYFEGGKEDILFAIFDELYDDLARLTAEAFSPETTAGVPIREAFRRYLESSFRFFLERQEQFMLLVKIAHQMTFSNDPAKSDYFKNLTSKIVTSLTPVLEAAIERGDLRPIPPVAMAHTIFGNINGMQMHMLLDCSETTQESCPNSFSTPGEAADFLTTVLFDGLVPRSDADAHTHTN